MLAPPAKNTSGKRGTPQKNMSMEEQISAMIEIYNAAGLSSPVRWYQADSPKCMTLDAAPMRSLDPIKHCSEIAEGFVSSIRDREKLAAFCKRQNPSDLNMVAMGIYIYRTGDDIEGV